MKTKKINIHNFENTIGLKPKRTRFYNDPNHITTMNAGEMVPIFWEEIIPGDIYKIKTQAVIRQLTLLKPIFDTNYIDITWFFVPTRLIWNDHQKFWGENDDAWAVKTEPTIPQTLRPNGGWTIGSIANYMGIERATDVSVSSLIFRGIAKIWNDWFRDQNLQDAAHIDKGSSQQTGSNGENYITDLEKGGMCAPTNKYHDYYTSALPAPQKGIGIPLPIGQLAPVHGKDQLYSTEGDKGIGFELPNTDLDKIHNVGVSPNGTGKWSPLTVDNSTGRDAKDDTTMKVNNLWADLSQAVGVSINDLRKAITAQQIQEIMARGGTRYPEILKSLYNVNNGDARMQRSEYLGGQHTPLTIAQIPQTSEGTEKSPLANLGAFGQSNIINPIISKAFTEHGYLYGIATIRYKHTYQQGLHRNWTKKSKLDFYNPALANIGEQPILNREIFNSNDQNWNNQIFGFQEAWAEHRYIPSRTSGYMRSGETETLDIWHQGDYYTNDEKPTLSDQWIREDKKPIDRTLAIPSNKTHQFLAEFNFQIISDRPLPAYSIPGLNKI